MLDFFTIFSKGGIVLWCFRGTADFFTPSVNALIKSVILQERGGNAAFDHEGLTLQYRLDNEFELIFVVAYQRILQLSYIDKFLDDVHLEFRDKYKNDLQQGHVSANFDFQENFLNILSSAEEWAKKQDYASRTMKSFKESSKSKKTVGSMIENRKDINAKKETKQQQKERKKENGAITSENSDLDAEMIEKKKMELMKTKKSTKKPKKVRGPKTNTVWELDVKATYQEENNEEIPIENSSTFQNLKVHVGTRIGDVPNIDLSNKNTNDSGMFSMFKGFVGAKSISREDMAPVLEKMKDHLISKNVAAEIAEKLSHSVCAKLEGKVLGTFTGISSTVKSSLNEALLQLLTPKHRIDILRDVLEAKRAKRPYVITFCGVNGVGKSTNLAKICFWLIENDLRVLVAACDTFRAGAVEQLRTHVRHLNALHPPRQHSDRQMVQLYEKGYGKDAAGIATEAIHFARDTAIDVVLVDTAGRMQDNLPLMRSLSKLIHINQPDLVLFVGEALVGNEAVDQLVKFNQALADHSTSENPHLIDGIVLTKFDTIDDKVGAAISMTYITGQPIVFVGTGQTYVDLKQLNAKAVVRALMK